MTAGPHAADEHASVQGMALHADPVAQKRTARVGRVRVHGNHRNRLAMLAEERHQRVDESRLAGARRAGDADNLGPPNAVAKRLQQVADGRVALLDQRDGAGQAANLALAELGRQVPLAHESECRGEACLALGRGAPPQALGAGTSQPSGR